MNRLTPAAHSCQDSCRLGSVPLTAASIAANSRRSGGRAGPPGVSLPPHSRLISTPFTAGADSGPVGSTGGPNASRSVSPGAFAYAYDGVVGPTQVGAGASWRIGSGAASP